MTIERWQRIADIFHAAQDRQGDERAAFVRQAADNSDILREVESLLAADEDPMVLDLPIGATAHAVLADNAAVDPGTSIGHYRIDSLLGVGGMGEVYRARDTKLNRDVAIKILPTAVASDPERLARFKREAQVLASLNHPNIGGIYGFEDGPVGQAAQVHALVLELVDGPTLADRIARGLLPLDEALAIARQIADALEAAHEQGIIHRDLKPANIKVREDGTVKVLDFGLAKIAETSQISGPTSQGYLTQSPTITTPAMTAAGMILGTAAYMSPEQAKGKAADKRSDVWAFGCVLYEMLTGTRPFAGDDVADTLAAILKSEPDWQLLPSATPAVVIRLLRRSLVKDVRQRIGDATVLRLDVAEGLDGLQHGTAPATGDGRSSRGLVIAVAAVALLATVAALAAWRRLPAVPMPPERRFDIATPDTRELPSLALSPDGSKLAYVSDATGRSILWVRDLKTGEIRQLGGTAGALMPFWSPKADAIGFAADGRLKRIDLASGTIRDLAPAPGSRMGGSWGPDGSIVYSPSGTAGISRVSDTGGAVSILTRVPVPATLGGHRTPIVLPDGHHFLFFVPGGAQPRGVYVGSMAGDEPRLIVEADSTARYARGRLFFVRGVTLLAQPFDPDTLRLFGDAVVVAQPVANLFGTASFSVANDGTIVYRAGEAGDRRQLTWFDRTGTKLRALGDVDVGTRLSGVELSPDGTRLLAGRMVNGQRNVWLFDFAQGTWTRVTNSNAASQPAWSPDGHQFAFILSLGGWPDLFVRPASIAGRDEAVFRSEALKGLGQWTPVSNSLVFTTVQPEGTQDILGYSFAHRQAFEVVATPADEADPQVSPDGRVAYQSNESTRFEVYVRPFRKDGERVQVSRNGGAQVRWSRDGRELYFLDLDERVNAAVIAVHGDRIASAPPVVLFQVRVPGGVIQTGGSHQQYDVSRDGHFLVNRFLPDPAQPPITILQNWRSPNEGAK